MSIEEDRQDANQVLISRLKAQNAELADGHNQMARLLEDARYTLKTLQQHAAEERKFAELKLRAKNAECKLLRYMLRQAQEVKESDQD